MSIDYKKLGLSVLLASLGAASHYFASVPTPAAAAFVAVLVGVQGAMQSFLVPASTSQPEAKK